MTKFVHIKTKSRNFFANKEKPCNNFYESAEIFSSYASDENKKKKELVVRNKCAYKTT